MMQSVRDRIVEGIEESIRVKHAVLDQQIDLITQAATWMVETLSSNGKILLCGNGGSAADCQHIAAEFIGRFEKERRAWPAIALTTDTSILTALGNDYGVETVFARQIEAIGQSGDLLMAFSTSGASPNVVRAVQQARAQGLRTITFTGEMGGPVADEADLTLKVPSRRTARVQEAHITICHTLCHVVEEELYATTNAEIL